MQMRLLLVFVNEYIGREPWEKIVVYEIAKLRTGQKEPFFSFFNRPAPVCTITGNQKYITMWVLREHINIHSSYSWFDFPVLYVTLFPLLLGFQHPGYKLHQEFRTCSL